MADGRLALEPAPRPDKADLFNKWQIERRQEEVEAARKTPKLTDASATGRGARCSLTGGGGDVSGRLTVLETSRGLTLRKANNETGYFGVVHQPGEPKPYRAQVLHVGKCCRLGNFATAREAALCVARSPEGQEAAQRAAAAPPLTSEEARQQAQAEGLTLVVAENTTGYFGVHLNNPGQPKPYQAQVRRGGKMASLGCFATAEEAALCVARSPEGQAKERKAVANENAIVDRWLGLC